MSASGCLWLEKIATLGRDSPDYYLESCIRALQLWKALDIKVVHDVHQTELRATFSKRAPEPKVFAKPEILWEDEKLSEADRWLCEGIRSSLSLKPERLTLERRGSSFAKLEIVPESCSLNLVHGKSASGFEASLVMTLGGGSRILAKENLARLTVK